MKSLVIYLVLIVVCAHQFNAQRFVRQSGRYGVSNYRPVLQGLPAAVRGNAVLNAGVKPAAAPVGGTRPLQGVGAYTFGGAASGRPSFGPSYGYNAGGGGGGPRPQATLNTPQAVKSPQNQVYRGNNGPQRPLTYNYN